MVSASHQPYPPQMVKSAAHSIGTSEGPSRIEHWHNNNGQLHHAPLKAWVFPAVQIYFLYASLLLPGITFQIDAIHKDAFVASSAFKETKAKTLFSLPLKRQNTEQEDMQPLPICSQEYFFLFKSCRCWSMHLSQWLPTTFSMSWYMFLVLWMGHT